MNVTSINVAIFSTERPSSTSPSGDDDDDECNSNWFLCCCWGGNDDKDETDGMKGLLWIEVLVGLLIVVKPCTCTGRNVSMQHDAKSSKSLCRWNDGIMIVMSVFKLILWCFTKGSGCWMQWGGNSK